MLSIRTNGVALQASGSLARTNRSLSNSLSKISSGKRTSEIGVDSAGLAVSVNLDTRSQSYTAAVRNINDGISVVQTAEQIMDTTTDLLQRMRELSVQSASETLADPERSFITDEFDVLRTELQRLGLESEFNGIKLADGTVPTVGVQVGIDSGADSQISLGMPNLRAVFFGVNSSSVSSAADARTTIDAVDTQLLAVNSDRATLGAGHNRLLSALNSAGTNQMALSSASSRIVDTDFATETAKLSKLQVMQSAGISALGQSRTLSRAVLELVR
jgi:flagellin